MYVCTASRVSTVGGTGPYLSQEGGLNLPEEDIVRLTFCGLSILALLVIQYPYLLARHNRRSAMQVQQHK